MKALLTIISLMSISSTAIAFMATGNGSEKGLVNERLNTYGCQIDYRPANLQGSVNVEVSQKTYVIVSANLTNAKVAALNKLDLVGTSPDGALQFKGLSNENYVIVGITCN